MPNHAYYPVQPHSSGHMMPQAPGGVCAVTQPRFEVGRFKTTVCLADCTDKLVQYIISKMSPAAAVGAPDVSVELPELLACLFLFNSNEVEIFKNTQVNQACTFFIEPQLLGLLAGASHYKEVPVYCNVVAQLPGIGRDGGLFGSAAWNLVVPDTVGQLNLQYNVGVNPTFIFGNPLVFDLTLSPVEISQKLVMTLGLLPFFSKGVIKRDSAIYKGFI